MIARGFKPVAWVAAVAGAALSCYMLSLNVAAERAELLSVERQIIAAKRDIRALQTELGTRGRLTQLEQWNTQVLALSSPNAKQFLESEFILASFAKPPQQIDTAKVRMASADTVRQPDAQPRAEDDFANRHPATPMLRQASLVVGDQAKSETQGKSEEKKLPKAELVRSASKAARAPVKVAATKAPLAGSAVKAVALAKAAPVKAASVKAVIKTAAAKPAAKRKPVSSTSLIDDAVLGDIRAAAKQEKKSGGAGHR